MKSLRMLGALFVAVFAFAVVGVSVASASTPEFVSGNGKFPINFLFTSATSVLGTASQTIICSLDVGTGTITGTDTVAGVQISFSGCNVTTVNGTCPIQSVKPLGTAGLIDTVTLKGELGTVAVAEAASLVGLLLEPESGKAEYTTLKATGAPCSTIESAVTGKIAGEVKPVKGGQSRFGTVTLTGPNHSQTIKEIDELGKGFVEIPTLKAFGLGASEVTTETIDFSVSIEVT